MKNAWQLSKREQALWLKSRTVESPSGCWEWTGGKHGVGYGAIPAKLHKSRYAHRAMYEAVCSQIPAGIYVLHTCDNRLCLNPAHLWLGTHLENIKDMQAKGRHRGGSLPGESNPWCKFSDAVVALIRQRAASGIPKRLIEKEFGISETQYYRYIKNEARRSA